MGIFTKQTNLNFKSETLKKVFEQIRDDLKIEIEKVGKNFAFPITKKLKYIVDGTIDYTDFVNFMSYLKFFRDINYVVIDRGRLIFFEYITDSGDYFQGVIDTLTDEIVESYRTNIKNPNTKFVKFLFPVFTISGEMLSLHVDLKSIKLRNLRYGSVFDKGQTIYYKILNTKNEVELKTGMSTVSSVVFNDVRLIICDTLFMSSQIFSTSGIFTESLLKQLLTNQIGENSLINGRAAIIEIVGIAFEPIISLNPVIVIDITLNNYILRIFYDYLSSSNKIAGIRRFSY